MSTPPDKTPTAARFSQTMLGIFDLARGRAGGLRYFGNTPQAVLAALTPLVAFMLVGGAVALLGRRPDAVTALVAVAVALLCPMVLSFEVARWWGRAPRWPLFAVAYCWCQWAAPMAMAGMLVLVSVLMAAGLDGDTAMGIGVAALFGYGLWLNWFLARHALALSGWRAAALVAVVNVSTMVLILIPQAADYLLNGPPPA